MRDDTSDLACLSRLIGRLEELPRDTLAERYPDLAREYPRLLACRDALMIRGAVEVTLYVDDGHVYETARAYAGGPAHERLAFRGTAEQAKAYVAAREHAQQRA